MFRKRTIFNNFLIFVGAFLISKLDLAVQKQKTKCSGYGVEQLF